MSYSHVCKVILFQCTRTIGWLLLIHPRRVIRRPFKGVVTRWNSDYEEVKATNIFMGDLQCSLVLMLEDDGCDTKLLKYADSKSAA
jgi:hypothetical protein